MRFKALNGFLDFIHCNEYFFPCCSIKKFQVFFIDGLLEIRVVCTMGRGDNKLFEVGGPTLEDGVSLIGGAIN